MLKYTQNKLSTFERSSSFKKNTLKLISFAIVFVGLKLNALSAALILSKFFPFTQDFGRFDYALTVGLLLTIFIGGGLHVSIPFYLLKEKKKEFESVFYFHGLLISSLFLITFWLIHVYSNQSASIILLSISLAVIITLQNLAAIINKSKEKIYLAVFLEASLFLTINCYNLYLLKTSGTASIEHLQYIFIALVFILANFYGIKFMKHRKCFSIKKYFLALKFGRPLILGLFLIILLTGSGRILAGHLWGMETVGIYGIYFRMAAIVILVHQILNIAFFKKIYQGQTNLLDYWFEKYLLGIILLSFIIYYLIPFLSIPYLTIVANSWNNSKLLMIALQVQMFLWIILALFENVINREKLSTAFNKGILWIILTTGVIILLSQFSPFFNLELLILLNSGAIYFAVEWQLRLLRKKGIPFVKTQRFLRLTIIASIILITFSLLYI